MKRSVTSHAEYTESLFVKMSEKKLIFTVSVTAADCVTLFILLRFYMTDFLWKIHKSFR